MSYRLPACSPDELTEELADIDRDINQLENANSVSPEAHTRAKERLDGLRAWREGLTAQRVSTRPTMSPES